MEELSKFLNARLKRAASKKEGTPILLSTRIRLARNLSSFPFSARIGDEERLALLSLCSEKIQGIEPFAKSMQFLMDEATELEKKILVERHLISKELSHEEEGSGVIINRDEKLAIMINEEDHLRIQYMFEGMGFARAWKKISEIDDLLEKQLPYAYSGRLGYLTSCPTNLGTGLRVSAMLHLPGLVSTNLMDKVVRAVNQLGMTVRGWLGEGSDATGSIFQISNQQTLGESEEQIIYHLEGVFKTIIEQEQYARLNLIKQDRMKLFDKLGRSCGVLKNAQILSSAEAMNMLSLVRMAIDLDLFAPAWRPIVDRLFIECQPGHITQIFTPGREMTPQDRDTRRAELVRERLADLPNFTIKTREDDAA